VETRRTRIPLPLPVASVAKEQRLFNFLSSRRLSERWARREEGKKEERERERESGPFLFAWFLWGKKSEGQRFD
jgi:hypothetical protein